MAKAKLSDEQAENIEAKVIPALLNEPSEPYKIHGYKFVFKSPKMMEKYKGRIWSTAKIKEIGLDPEATYPDGTEESNFSFFVRLLGNLNINVFSITYPNGQLQALDDEYKFVFEQFLNTEAVAQGWDEEEFATKVLEKFVEWSNGTPSEDDIKNS